MQGHQRWSVTALSGKLWCSLDEELPLPSAKQPDVKLSWNPVYSLPCHTRPTKTLAGGSSILVWPKAWLSWRPQDKAHSTFTCHNFILASSSQWKPNCLKGTSHLPYFTPHTLYVPVFRSSIEKVQSFLETFTSYNKASYNSAGLWFILGKYVRLTESQQVSISLVVTITTMWRP